MASRSAAATALTLLVVGGLVARATQIYFSGSKEAMAAGGTGPRAEQVDPGLAVGMEPFYFFPEVDIATSKQNVRFCSQRFCW